MATQWFCRLMGSDLGPFSASEMVELVRQKRLTAEDLIRKGSSGDWVPAYAVQGLFDAAARGTTSAVNPARSSTPGTPHSGAPHSGTAPSVPMAGGSPQNGSPQNGSPKSHAKVGGRGQGASKSTAAARQVGKGRSKVAESAERPGPKSLSGLLSALLAGGLGGEKNGQDKSGPPADVPLEVRRKETAPPPGPPRPGVALEERRWYCIVEGERHGPMSYDALQRIAASGRLKSDDRVWSTACPRWSRAGDILGLVDS